MSSSRTPTLKQALASWRRTRTETRAGEVETLGAETAKRLGPADWDLSTFDEYSLSRVLDWLPAASDGQVLPVLRRLRAMLPDPRVTRPLLALLGKDSPRPIERATLVDLLERNADPRQSSLAEVLGVARELAIAQAELPHLLTFARERDTMLQRLFEAPDDLHVRTITADWLVGFGDPLGELMALQLARGDEPATEREEALLKVHATAFLADLFSPAPVMEVRFERGVPAVLTLQRPMTWRLECSTVHTIRFLSGSYRDLLPSQWKRVRSVRPAPEFSSSAPSEVVQRFREVWLTPFALLCDDTLELYGDSFDEKVINRARRERPTLKRVVLFGTGLRAVPERVELVQVPDVRQALWDRQRTLR